MTHAPYLPYDPEPDASFNFNTIEIWEKEPLEILYHYTSASGALGVIGDNALRASSVAMLNDTGEFSHGEAFIASRWRQVKGSPAFSGWEGAMSRFLAYISQTTVGIGNYYACCASTQLNSLSQFQLYGSYVVHVDASPFLRAKRCPGTANEDEPGGADETPLPDSRAFHWRRVRYSLQDQTHLADITIYRLYNILEMFLGSSENDVDFARLSPTSLAMATYAYAEGACFMKHESFRDEHEARYVVEVDIRDKAVRIRDGRYGLTPYVELVPDDATNKASEKREEILVGAGIGPGPRISDRRAAVFGLEAVIKRAGLAFQVDNVDYPLR